MPASLGQPLWPESDSAPIDRVNRDPYSGRMSLRNGRRAWSSGLVTLVGFMAACAFGACTTEPTLTPIPVPTPTPTIIPASLESIIRQAAEEFAGLTSVRFTLTHEVGSTKLLGMEIKEVAVGLARPDRLEATLSGSASGFFVRVEARVLGQDAYLRDPLTGNWSRSPTGTSRLAFFDPDAGIGSILQAVGQLTRLPDEDLNGLPMYRVQGTMPASALRPLVGIDTLSTPVEVDLWVGQDDFLLHMAVIRGAVLRTDDIAVRRLSLSSENVRVIVQ